MVSFLAKKNNGLLGIDISSSSIKLLELSKSGSKYKVECYASRPLPDGSVVEKNIANLDAVGETMLKLASLVDASTDKAAVAVSGSAVITKSIAMNAALTDSEIETQIALEADQYIPYPLDEVLIDFERQGLSEKDPEMVEVLLAPLITEYIEINYADAATISLLLSGEGGRGSILSERGTATVDARTNTLIVQDVAAVLSDIRNMIRQLDIPVRQVLIEARIVNASTSFSDALGVRWGGGQTFPDAGDRFVISGSQEASIGFGSNVDTRNLALAGDALAGVPIGESLVNNPFLPPTFPDALVVDMGVEQASSIALGFAGNKGMLELELSALESSGNGEVIAQPKVTTQDQQLARIESGVQIPCQAQAGGTAGGSTTEFVSAVLALEVTPQITPDGRINMLLQINQDSVVPGAGAVPAIATNSVITRVLVNDGDTIVLGGVFREEITTTVTKTPVLGDLPYVGNLFKRTENAETKTELLIFITPSIINELL